MLKCQYCQSTLLVHPTFQTCDACHLTITHLFHFFIRANKPNTLGLIAAARAEHSAAVEAHRKANEDMIDALKQKNELLKAARDYAEVSADLIVNAAMDRASDRMKEVADAQNKTRRGK
jgi:hypothetical protein